jgi:alpha/beta superfamily hydrolase
MGSFSSVWSFHNPFQWTDIPISGRHGRLDPIHLAAKMLHRHRPHSIIVHPTPLTRSSPFHDIGVYFLMKRPFS